MSLMVKCKGCGETFPSKIQMLDTSKWHNPILINEINQECPNCKKNFSYTKEDHFILLNLKELLLVCNELHQSSFHQLL